MNTINANYFFDTIAHLRSQEEVLLFQRITTIREAEVQDVVLLLETEYSNECLEYPFQPPAFDVQAAVWAAQLVYHAAQLILYRDQEATDIGGLLPAYSGRQTAGAILSADLCLRFLKPLLSNIKAIDPDDPIIAHLDAHLATWHYSAIGYALPTDTLQWNIILENPCLKQLYTDRVLAVKDKTLATLPALKEQVFAALGDHAGHFWKDITL